MYSFVKYHLLPTLPYAKPLCTPLMSQHFFHLFRQLICPKKSYTIHITTIVSTHAKLCNKGDFKITTKANITKTHAAPAASIKPESFASPYTDKSLDTLPSGRVRYTMMNDFMFHSVLQHNIKALKGLLCALLHLPKNSITDIQIMNPIEFGKDIISKICVLDLKVKINHNKIINIEMQVANLGDWKERSLTYLCRNFDNMQSGDEYIHVTPCVHIGILDFSLEGLTPKLYSEYKMIDTKTSEIYSDKLSLYVLNLRQTDNPDYEQEDPELYYWAKLFKATEWEEFKMLAEKNEDIKEVVFTLHEMSEEEKIRQECEARERYYCEQKAIERMINEGIREGMREGMREGIELNCTL